MVSKTWENSILQLKQLDGVGLAHARLLSNAGIDSFKKIMESDARTIEYVVNRNPPFGNKVVDSIKKFPLFLMEISVVIILYIYIKITDLSKPYKVELNCHIGLKNPDNVALKSKKGVFYGSIFLVSTSSNVLLHYSRMFLSKLKNGENVRITHKAQANERIICSLMSEDFGTCLYIIR